MRGQKLTDRSPVNPVDYAEEMFLRGHGEVETEAQEQPLPFEPDPQHSCVCGSERTEPVADSIGTLLLGVTVLGMGLLFWGFIIGALGRMAGANR